MKTQLAAIRSWKGGPVFLVPKKELRRESGPMGTEYWRGGERVIFMGTRKDAQTYLKVFLERAAAISPEDPERYARRYHPIQYKQLQEAVALFEAERNT